MQEHVSPQRIPVKLYRTVDRLTVAAPMPGLEPENIEVEVTSANHLVLRGSVRGLHQEDKPLLLDEWTVGDYFRDLELPLPVNGDTANVTYGNGVVVVVMPLAERTMPAQLRMQTIADDKGERVGSAGHPPHPISTEQHEANLVNEWLLHGGNPRVTPEHQERPGTGRHG
jgi:HSP20 family protein